MMIYRMSGWGILSSGSGIASSFLQQARVAITSDAVCSSNYPSQIHISMVCAQSPGNGLCRADTGGPLVCEHQGKWYLEGIVSWGEGCYIPPKPRVFAKLGLLQAWVDGIINS